MGETLRDVALLFGVLYLAGFGSVVLWAAFQSFCPRAAVDVQHIIDIWLQKRIRIWGRGHGVRWEDES